jgi:hypothetical protein
LTSTTKRLESIFGFDMLYELMWGMKEHHIQSYYLMIREKAREHKPMTRQEFENLDYKR